MSGTIEFLYNPGQTVWVIQTVGGCTPSSPSALAVREGSVLRIRATINLQTVPVGGSPLVYDGVEYDVRLGTSAGTNGFAEEDVFGSLADAITAYEARI